MSEKDINRWQALIAQRPEGPWAMSGPHGSSYDRTVNAPISDEMLEELALWLRLGYTPWNGRSMPLSSKDREFMFLLYFSVQGLISRVRAAEKALAESASPMFLVQLPDGTLVRKAQQDLQPNDLMVFDGPDAFASTDAAQRDLDAEIASAGGLDAWRATKQPGPTPAAQGMKAPSHAWLTKMAELGDPPACPACGAMAGVCSDYPKCPGGTQTEFPEESVAEQIAQAQIVAADAARAGVQGVSAGFDDLPFEGCPEEWCEKLFCRIAWFYDPGDSSVGEPARYGWSLADDQSGTVIGDLASKP